MVAVEVAAGDRVDLRRGGKEVAACFPNVLNYGCMVETNFWPERFCAEAAAYDQCVAVDEARAEGEEGG